MIILHLTGDSSDNIPGVPKVGPKTAAKWLTQYGSLDAVMRQADEIKGKVGESLRATLDMLPLSRELTTIRCDLELQSRRRICRCRRRTRNDCGSLYTQLDFSRLLEELDGELPGRCRRADAVRPGLIMKPC